MNNIFETSNKMTKIRTAIAGFVAGVLIFFPAAMMYRPMEARALASGSAIVVSADATRDPIMLTLNAVAWAAAKQLIGAMTQSVISWINSGFEGNPMFLTNPEAYFLDIANEVTGALISEIGANMLCEPFKPEIFIGLTHKKTFRERYQCTAIDVLDNVHAFYDDFVYGGWAGYVTVLEPQNNYFGVIYALSAEKARRIAEAQNRSQSELSQGSGFLTMKKCVEYDPEYESDPESYAKVTGYGEWGDYHKKDGIEGCMRTENTTPGDILGDQISSFLRSPQNQLELADTIGESIGAIVNALINQLILSGLRGLSGGGGSSEPWYASGLKEDKNALIGRVDKDIADEEKRVGVSDNLEEGLTAIDKAKICYNDQIATINDEDFNPPENFGVPTESEIRKKITILDDKRDEAVLTFSGASVAQSIKNLEYLKDLRGRIEIAETPTDLADLWSEHTDYQNRLDHTKREEEKRAIDKAYEEKGKIDKELAMCEEKLTQLKSYVGRSRTVPVECVSGCEPTGGTSAGQ